MTMIERALTVEKLREQLTDEGIIFTEETLNTLAEEVIRDYDNDDVRAACWEAAMNEAVERAHAWAEDKAWKTYRMVWKPRFTETIEARSPEEAARKFADRFDNLMGGYQITKDLGRCLVVEKTV